MNNNGIGFMTQLVGIPHIVIYIEGGADKKTHSIMDEYGLFGEFADGFYVVKPECADELKARRIRYTEIARHPMPKEVRYAIRKELKKNGVLAPI
jgi:hypothetical protein